MHAHGHNLPGDARTQGCAKPASRTSRKPITPFEQIQEHTRTKSCSAARFNEFVVQLQGASDCIKKAMSRNTYPVYPFERFYPELANSILVCVTETTRR